MYNRKSISWNNLIRAIAIGKEAIMNTAVAPVVMLVPTAAAASIVSADLEVK